MAMASAYFDESGEFLIFPISESDAGAPTEVNEPERLQWDGSSVQELGDKILKCLTVSKQRIGPPVGQTPAWKLATGESSWRTFAKTRQYIGVDSDDEAGSLTIEFWRRNSNFMYSGRIDDPPEWTVTLPLDASAEAVGGAVIQVLRAANVAGV